MPKSKLGFGDFDPAAIASNLPEPLQWLGGTALGGLKSALGLIGGDTPETSAGASLGGPLMAAEGELTPIAKKAGDALGGLYSRVSRTVSKLPESIHPNKLASVLKNQANPEEVEFRNLGGFLSGNNQVKKADLLSHLEANPEPEINLVNKQNTYHPSKPIESMHPGEYANYLDNLRNNQTKYHGYQLPGGENYKENLITSPVETKQVPTGEYLHTTMKASDPTKGPAFMRQPNDELDLDTMQFIHPDDLTAEGIYRSGHATGGSEYGKRYAQRFGHDLVHSEPEMKTDLGNAYQSPHWDEPNVLVHSRTQDRPLNPTTQWGPEHFQHEVPDPDNPMFALRGREYAFRRADGQLISGFGNSPEEALRDVVEAHGKPWMGGDTPPQLGPKIRNIENIQSDWHQAGAKHGYVEPVLTPEQQRLRDVANGHREDGETWVADAIDSQLVPDAPFKDKGWLDLALKHQLLDVANNPSIEGISVTPGSEMVRRGEGQSPVFNDQQIPNALKRLLKPFGGGEPSMLELGNQPIHRSNGTFGTIIGGETGNTDLPYSGNVLLNEGQGNISNIASIWPQAATKNDAMSRVHLLKDLVDQTQPLPRSPSLKAPYFQITPAMKEALKKQGLPLLSILGLAAAQPNQGEQ